MKKGLSAQFEERNNGNAPTTFWRGKHLEFYDDSNPKQKTKRFFVFTRGAGQLGRIGWYAKWRRYNFFPLADCTFDSACLEEISHFMKVLMFERKQNHG
jgi:hypothetical protein